MKRSLLVLLPLVLTGFTGCAAMEEQHRAQVCNREFGYEKGSNDAEEGQPMSSSFAAVCDPETKREVMQGYREGYEKTKNESTIEIGKGGVRVKGGGININLGDKSSKSWSCEINIFGDHFTGFGVSRAQAAADVRRLCEAKHNGIHCGNPNCEKER